MRGIQEENMPLPAVQRKILMFDGAAVDVEVAASPFTHGGKSSVQVVMRDITERKEADDRSPATFQLRTRSTSARVKTAVDSR
jgi:PAS domain S-box-containing protein